MAKFECDCTRTVTHIQNIPVTADNPDEASDNINAMLEDTNQMARMEAAWELDDETYECETINEL